MTINAGFDLVPRVSRGTEDSLRWAQFIDAVRLVFDSNESVEFGVRVVTFKLGDQLSLPIEGRKFLRFSSNISGGITTRVALKAYIQQVTALAEASFGARVRAWQDDADQHGFYDWASVHTSIKSYDRSTLEPESVQVDRSNTARSNTPGPTATRLYEVMEIPGRGKGLVAKVHIPKGTRIISEKPFTLESIPNQQLHEAIAGKAQARSRDEHRQFLSLDNVFPGQPGQHDLAGIMNTNAFCCGSDSTTGGIYFDIARLNHSCIPNAHNNWNGDAQHETIHALKNILVGEEILVCYDIAQPSDRRWAKLNESFGFQCHCDLCTGPANELILSDIRRLDIERMDNILCDLEPIRSDPLYSLGVCYNLHHALQREYGYAATSLMTRLYYVAFQIGAAHGDQARASVFAGREYRARVECEGEDSPAAQKAKAYMEDPTKHLIFGSYSNDWSSVMTEKPVHLDVPDFEKWLWRESD